MGLNKARQVRLRQDPAPSTVSRHGNRFPKAGAVVSYNFFIFYLPEVSMLETLSSGSPNKENSRKMDSLLNSTTPLKKVPQIVALSRRTLANTLFAARITPM